MNKMNLSEYDYIVVGASLSVSFISRKLAEDEKNLIIKSRSKISVHIYHELNEIAV